MRKETLARKDLAPSDVAILPFRSIGEFPLFNQDVEAQRFPGAVVAMGEAIARPEVMVGQAQAKFDEKTGELTDKAMREFIAQQLQAFAAFARRRDRVDARAGRCDSGGLRLRSEGR